MVFPSERNIKENYFFFSNLVRNKEATACLPGQWSSGYDVSTLDLSTNINLFSLQGIFRYWKWESFNQNLFVVQQHSPELIIYYFWTFCDVGQDKQGDKSGRRIGLQELFSLTQGLLVCYGPY